MSDWKRPLEGTRDAETATETVAAPLDGSAVEPGGVATDDPAVAVDDEVVRARHRARPDTVVLLLGGILLVVIAQIVLGWSAYNATTQLRDQYTIANGLQRCLIEVQLNQNAATDTAGTAYKNAVQACLNK